MKTPSADQLCILPKRLSHEIYRRNPAYFQTIELHYHANALAIRALAPLWEIERAANQGYLSAKLQGQTSPHYLKRTSWLNNQDGFLVLDKNINGSLDNGEEMFSNSKVNEQNRGVASLAVIDADGNGKIDSADAVFNNLVVWQDANGNGRMDDGEGKALAALGISSLNYEAGTVTRNGQASTQMHTLTLDADTLGTSFTPKGDGIVLQTTDGQTTLQVTKLRRLREQVIVALDDFYLEKDSNTSRYDGDIGAKNLRNWSVGYKVGRQLKKSRVCVRWGRHENQGIQEKNKQYHCHMVIVRSVRYSVHRQSLNSIRLTHLGAEI